MPGEKECAEINCKTKCPYNKTWLKNKRVQRGARKKCGNGGGRYEETTEDMF